MFHVGQESFNHFVSPEPVLSFSEGQIVCEVQIVNPVYDYVPPDLVTLFITNMLVVHVIGSQCCATE